VIVVCVSTRTRRNLQPVRRLGFQVMSVQVQKQCPLLRPKRTRQLPLGSVTKQR
jgi:hypothetical protein